MTVHILEELKIPSAINRNRRLSDSDKSVFGLAIQLDAFILTGDNVVRKVSGVQRIEVHGVLLLFDQFLEKKLITVSGILPFMYIFFVTLNPFCAVNS